MGLQLLHQHLKSKTQFLDQVKIKSASQLINGIFKALKKNYVNVLAE